MDTRLKTFLTEGTVFAALATLDADGGPQNSLVWIDADDRHVLINTSEGRVKTRNVRADGRVALTAFDPSNPYEQAMIRGVVAQITGYGAEDHIDRLARRYMGVDRYPYRAPGEVRLIVRVTPARVSWMG